MNVATEDLVVAVAIGYGIAEFSVFVGSLRHHFTGDVLLYGSADTSGPVRSYCAQKRVELRTDSVALGLNTTTKMRLMHSRFLLYVRACARPRYGLCLASDFRDIFFQSNPFTALRLRYGSSTPPDLLAPMEIEHHEQRHALRNATGAGTIGASPINRNWLRTCYGDGAAFLMDSKSILNDGEPKRHAADAQRSRERRYPAHTSSLL